MSRFFATLSIALLLAVQYSPAQSTGEITVVITDSTAASVAGAGLSLLQVGTGVVTNGTSNAEGVFRFPALIPGRYSLTVSAKGFAETKVTDISVEVNRISRADVALQIAASQQAVEVRAAAQMLDMESGGFGQIVNNTQMQNLPMLTKNPLQLITLTPGTTGVNGGQGMSRQGSDGTGLSSIYVINGGVRTNLGGFQEYVVDGLSMTNRRDGTIMALPALDSLEEFKVQSGGMSAEFGHTVGGVVNYVTKSGSNALHGTLFEKNGNKSFTARQAIPAIGAKPPNVYNQFGGSVGGPVFVPKVYDGRNRTFFHFGYEGIRNPRGAGAVATIPTPRMHDGDFAELSSLVYDPASSSTPGSRTPFPVNRIPTSRFNPIGKKILDLFPAPNLPGLSNNAQGIELVVPPTTIYTARVDETISERQRLFAKVTVAQSAAAAYRILGPVDGANQDTYFPTRNYMANYTRTFSPSVVYTVSAGYAIFRRWNYDSSGNQVGAGRFGYSVNPAQAPGSPANVQPYASFDIYKALGTNGSQNQIAETFQVNQNVAWMRGKHTVRFGVDLRRYYSSGFITGGAPNGTWGFNAAQTGNGAGATGNSAASLLLGLADTLTIQQVPALRLGGNVPALFVMDDFKVSRRLTVNIGLRWEGDGEFTEKHDRVGSFDSQATNTVVKRPGVFQYAGLNGAARGVKAGDYNNWAPRVGFAFTPGGGRTVIRGAYGIYFAPVPLVGYYAAAPGFDTTLNPLKPAATEPAATLVSSYTLPAVSGPAGAAAYLGLGISQPVNRNLQNPLIHQWNFGVQRELARNVVGELAYVGNRGSRLLGSLNVNLPPLSLIQDAIAAQRASGTAGSALAYLNVRVNNPLSGLVPGTLGAATVTRTAAAAPFPQFSSISTTLNISDSVYHSLQAKLEKRMSSGLNLLLAYTFSKLLSNAPEANFDSSERPYSGTFQNPYNLRNERAVSSFDHTHMFSGTAIYSLPFGTGHRWVSKGWMRHVVGGFQLNGILTTQTGMPLGIYQSDANGLGVGGARPNRNGDPLAASQGTRGHINADGSVQWAARSAFSLVNGDFGNEPIRDASLRAPGFWQLDLGVHRDFMIRESVKLRFRAEEANAFNHTNMKLPEQNASSPSFGTISQSYRPRTARLGLELNF